MIVIVGGGCSGVLAAASLVKSAATDRIVIVEPREDLGRGLAYSTPWREHLLNAPARAMSAVNDDPTHFVRWLRHVGVDDGEAFVPRRIYGEYLGDVLRQATAASPGVAVTHTRATAVDVVREASGVTIVLDTGARVAASHVVLATGNSADRPSPLSSAGLLGSTNIAAVWEPDALTLHDPSARIVIIGSGLSAVDAIVALDAQRHVGPLHVISRRGRLPQVHRPATAGSAGESTSPANALTPMPLGASFRALRGRLRQSGEWRAVVDAQRALTNVIWARWTVTERQRFMRHARVYWETHRHRMAPAIAAILDRCHDEGRLHVRAGRVVDISGGTPLQIRVARRDGVVESIAADRVLNGTGIEERYATSRRPIVRALLARGLASVNALGSGFAADEDGRLTERGGRVSGVCFTLGPPRYGDLLETVAVAEIRVQAARIARSIAGREAGRLAKASPR